MSHHAPPVYPIVNPWSDYKPLRTLTNTIVLFLGLVVFLNAIATVLVLVDSAMYPITEQVSDEISEGQLMLLMMLGLAGLGSLGASITTAVIFCMWMYRANRNARTLGAEGLTFTPGWCAGWWFIPFANLVQPFRAMKEIYQASEPEAGPRDWQFATVPAILGVWWGFWLTSNVVSQIEFRLSMQDDPQLVQASDYIGIVSLALTVVAAFAAASIVRRVRARQDQRHAILTQISEQSPAVADDAPPLPL